MHFDHGKNNIQIFHFCLFHRLYRRSEVTVESEDPLQKLFKKGIFVQEGQVEHVLTMANFKSNLPYLCPTLTNMQMRDLKCAYGDDSLHG